MSKGGYSVERFISEPENCFTCGICLQVLKDPVQCRNGHLLCKLCALEYIKAKPVCPSCACCMTENYLSNNIVVRNMILEKLVNCEHSGDGCLWVGKLCDSSVHESSECLSHTISCPSVGCNQTFVRKNLEIHLKSCQYAKIVCEFCEQLKPRVHCAECEQKPIVCTCGEVLLKFKMADHAKNSCESAFVSCPYKIPGKTGCCKSCPGFIQRKYLPEHISDPVNMAEALSNYASVVESMTAEIAALKKENVDLKANLTRPVDFDAFGRHVYSNAPYCLTSQSGFAGFGVPTSGPFDLATTSHFDRSFTPPPPRPPSTNPFRFGDSEAATGNNNSSNNSGTSGSGFRFNMTPCPTRSFGDYSNNLFRFGDTDTATENNNSSNNSGTSGSGFRFNLTPSNTIFGSSLINNIINNSNNTNNVSNNATQYDLGLHITPGNATFGPPAPAYTPNNNNNNNNFNSSVSVNNSNDNRPFPIFTTDVSRASTLSATAAFGVLTAKNTLFGGGNNNTTVNNNINSSSNSNRSDAKRPLSK